MKKIEELIEVLKKLKKIEEHACYTRLFEITVDNIKRLSAIKHDLLDELGVTCDSLNRLSAIKPELLALIKKIPEDELNSFFKDVSDEYFILIE